jgi:hypothetical protein
VLERQFPDAGTWTGTIIVPTGSASSIVAAAWLSVRAAGGGTVQAWFQRSADQDGSPPGSGAPWQNDDGSPVAFRNANRIFTQIPDGTEYLEYRVTTNGPGALLVEMQAK